MRNGLALLLLLALVIAVTAVVWLAQDDGDAPAPPVGDDEHRTAPTTTVEPIASLPNPADPGPTPPVRAADREPPAATRSAPTIVGPLVRVIDADGTPVRDAVVTFRTHLPGGSTWGFARRSPLQTFRTDPRGEVRIPFSARTAEVRVTHPRGIARFVGWSDFWPTTTPLELTLHAPQSMDVVVTDARGNAAGGVPLTAEPGPGVAYPFHATTDANGRATFHLSRFDLPPTEPRARVRLKVAIPLAKPLEHVATAAAWPAEPVRLSLPPTVPLQIELKTFDGAVESRPTWILVHAQRGRRRGPAMLRAHTATGRARFARVGVGASVHLIARRETIVASGTYDIGGPESAVQTIALQARTKDAVRLVGRIENPPAERATWQRLIARVRLAWKPYRPGLSERVETKEFDVRVEPGGGYRIGHYRRPIRIEEVRLLARDATGLIAASAPLVATLTEGRVDVPLGATTLVPVPLWVSGRVVDRLDRPIGFARISARARFSNPLANRSRKVGTISDASGAFAVRDTEHPVRVSVSARRLDHSEAELTDLPAGTAGVVLRIVEYGDIAGWVTLPHGFDAGWFYAGLIGSTAADPQRRWLDEMTIEANGEGRGKFRRGDVEPGPHDIVVHVVGSDTPLRRLVAVQVHERGATPDARLAGIDLRGAVQPVTVRIVGPDDRPLIGARVIASRDQKERYGPRQIVETDKRGEARLPASANGIGFEIAAPGFQVVRAETRRDCTIRLRAGIPVRFALGSAVRAHDPRTMLVMRLAPDVADRFATRAQSLYRALPADEDTIEFAVDRPGTYTATLRTCPRANGVPPRRLFRADVTQIVREVTIEVNGATPDRIALPIELRRLRGAERAVLR